MLTVVIPVYNRASLLSRCLDSIAEQTVRPARVIVVDDGSTDGSADVARRHRIGADVVEGRHAGAAAARNLGLERVTTEWTMFFDSDDVMLPTHIETAMAMAADDVDIVGWDIKYRTKSNRDVVRKFRTKDIRYHNLLHGSLSTQKYMARTSLFRRAGGWNPKVGVWDDIELGARLLNLQPRIVKRDMITVSVFAQEDSITGFNWSDKTEQFCVALDELSRTVPPNHRDWIDLLTAILAADIWREDAEDGKKVYSRISKKSMAVRLAHRYRRSGGRGTAHLFKPFFSRER